MSNPSMHYICCTQFVDLGFQSDIKCLLIQLIQHHCSFPVRSIYPLPSHTGHSPSQRTPSYSSEQFLARGLNSATGDVEGPIYVFSQRTVLPVLPELFAFFCIYFHLPPSLWKCGTSAGKHCSFTVVCTLNSISLPLCNLVWHYGRFCLL